MKRTGNAGWAGHLLPTLCVQIEDVIAPLIRPDSE